MAGTLYSALPIALAQVVGICKITLQPKRVSVIAWVTTCPNDILPGKLNYLELWIHILLRH